MIPLVLFSVQKSVAHCTKTVRKTRILGFYVWVVLHFVANACWVSVSAIHFGLGRQAVHFLGYAFLQNHKTTAWQVGAPYALEKKHIARNNKVLGGAIQRYTTRRMPWRKNNLQLICAEYNRILGS